MQAVFLVLLFILPSNEIDKRVIELDSVEECFRVAEVITEDYKQLYQAYAAENRKPEVPMLKDIACYYAEGQDA